MQQFTCRVHLMTSSSQGGSAGGGQGCHPSKDAKVAFWSTALWLIHWLWNSYNEHSCLKCTKIRLAAAIEGVLLLRGGIFQLTGLRTAQPHWNTRPNGNAEFPIVPTCPTFFWWRTNTGNCSSFRHSKKCKLPKMHQNTFAGRNKDITI